MLAGSWAAPSSLVTKEEGVDIVKREEFATERGTIVGAPADTLRTYGLATCVGMAASGSGSGGPVVNKVLGHIACDDAFNLINEYVRIVGDARLVEENVVISVVNPDILQEELRNAQKILNRSALEAMANILQGRRWRLKPYERLTIEGSDPLGTMRIEQDGSIQAEGVPMSLPSPADIYCYWPVAYTPDDRPQDEKDRMAALANSICLDGQGCPDGSEPQCQHNNERKLG
jgi:hypothetical protein